MNVLLTALLIYGSPGVGARVQLGDQVARYRITLPGNDALFPKYANNGYQQLVRQKGREMQLQVRVKNRQLASRVRGRRVSDLPGRLKDLERRLNAAADGYLADQMVILMTWLRHEIHYDTKVQTDQSLAAILQTGEANCVGLANLALYVLDKMDVRARYVTGLAWRMEDATKVHLEGNVLHRWIEVYYKDVGWVFCDPAGKVNFVEATYVVLGVQDVHPLPKLLTKAVGGQVELLHFKNGMRTIGRFPGADHRLRVRPNRLFFN